MERNISSMYHYTAAHLFEHMKTGLVDGKKREGADFSFSRVIKSGQKGLQPATPVMEFYSFPVPEGCNRNAVWGFLEPEPKQWKYSREFPQVWPRILKRVGWDRWEKPVILEVRLTTDDEIYVLDWAYIEEGSWKTKADDISRYWNSRVPFANYDGSFRLPEVLVFNPIPENRLFLYAQRDIHEIRREIEKLAVV